MAVENKEIQPNGDLSFILPSSNDDQIVDLNNKIQSDFMSYCYSFLNEDEDARQCVQLVWKKYLQYVGDVAMLAAFFDTLPYHIKTSILPKYQEEILRWCEGLFHIHSQTLLCSTYYAETFQRVIRYAGKNGQIKKGIIYIPADFDPNLKIDLISSLSNIQFEPISIENSYEEMINIHLLEELIQRDVNDTQAYPMMVIANTGSALLGRCDHLTKLKKLCEQYNIWLHVIGDLLGSLALLSTEKTNLTINCDSLTIDIMKLLGIQNLPYVTCFLRSITTTTEEKNSLVPSPSLNDFILHSPSISFLSVWSLNRRCSNEHILDHLKQSFSLTHTLITRLKQIETFQILNDEDKQENYTYQRICSGNTSNDVLPKPIVIFRFQPQDISEVENLADANGYIELLNQWLFDKLSQQYPKMNLELLKNTYFPPSKTDVHSIPTHALRFAPLEHLVDDINPIDMLSFVDDIQRYKDILLATMAARIRLSSAVSNYENLVSIPISTWAGIGAVRYIPSTIDRTEINETSAYEINTIQAELARQLQANDSAFSLGSEIDEESSTFYLRLGMIRKREDLDVLLEKICKTGKETETSSKYVKHMAEKIKMGIEKVQQDLHDENLRLIAQDGLLRQLPLVSNIMSWWSPAPSASPLATKGRSFDLNSGRVESTEDTYVHRIQVKKHSAHAPTHNDHETTTTNSNHSTEENTNQ